MNATEDASIVDVSLWPAVVRFRIGCLGPVLFALNLFRSERMQNWSAFASAEVTHSQITQDPRAPFRLSAWH
jgi:hypothetical protein